MPLFPLKNCRRSSSPASINHSPPIEMPWSCLNPLLHHTDQKSNQKGGGGMCTEHLPELLMMMVTASQRCFSAIHIPGLATSLGDRLLRVDNVFEKAEVMDIT